MNIWENLQIYKRKTQNKLIPEQIQQISEQIHKQNMELRNEVTVQLNQEKTNNQFSSRRLE